MLKNNIKGAKRFFLFSVELIGSIPVDSNKSTHEWMHFRTAFLDLNLREQAALRYAKRAALGYSSKTKQELEHSTT